MTTRKRILRILESDKPATKKYFKLKKLFGELKVKPAGKSSKDAIIEILPLLDKIYAEPTTDALCRNLTGLDIKTTTGFLAFLHKVIHEN